MAALQQLADRAIESGMDPAAPPPEINVNPATNELEPDIPENLRPLWQAATQAAHEMGPSSPYAQALRLVRLRRQGLIAALRLLGAIKAPHGQDGRSNRRASGANTASVRGGKDPGAASHHPHQQAAQPQQQPRKGRKDAHSHAAPPPIKLAEATPSKHQHR